MKRARRRRISPRRILVNCLSALFILIGYSPLPAYAQTPPCPTVPKAGPSSAWRQNAKITVDIDSRYSPAQQECIKAGIVAWIKNNSSTGNASGVEVVKWTVGQSSFAPDTMIIQQSAGYTNDIGKTTDYPGSDGRLSTALSTFNAGTTTCDALTELAGHEFGHTMGLADYCDASSGCGSPTDSIMTGPAPGAYDKPPGQGGTLINPNAIKGTAGHPLLAKPCDQTNAKEGGQYDPSKTNPPPANPPAAGSGGPSGRPEDYYLGRPPEQVCYVACWVTVYYVCGSSGCTYYGTTVDCGGTYCF